MTTNRVVIDPKIMGGKPVIKGTRIPLEILLKKLAQNLSVEDILEDYPQLTKKDIQAAIDYAAATLQNEEIFFLPKE